ncbi:MAG: hypothetical protein M2R45_04938 [Verrucomicrobia subdivision 3 bacterium]|nr:hypothetical protein [Limisphaerales bacterium]MCS1415625.1 hypothetical protein [Limisphaerales bacterium]
MAPLARLFPWTQPWAPIELEIAEVSNFERAVSKAISRRVSYAGDSRFFLMTARRIATQIIYWGELPAGVRCQQR